MPRFPASEFCDEDNPVHRFLVRLTGFAAIQAAIAATLLTLDPGYNYLTAIADKEARIAASRTGPRMLLVGGSNVAFGLDSGTLEATCPRFEVINLALSAGLGLDFMMNQAEAAAQSGDVIVLAPEYGHFADRSITHPAIDLLRIQPSAARHFSWSDWKALGDSGLSYLKYVFLRLKKSVRKTPSTIYCRQAFNEHGDVVAHHAATTTWNPPRYPDRWLLDERHLVGVVARVNQFVERCRRRGVTVVIELPPLAESSYAANAATVERIRHALQELCAAPILNPQSPIAFPDTQFFDTHYHLSSAGKASRTAALTAALQPLFSEPRESRPILAEQPRDVQ